MDSRFPALAASRRSVYAQVSIGIVKGLMTLSEPPDSLPAAQVGEEIVRALVGYFRAALVSEGLPLPADLT